MIAGKVTLEDLTISFECDDNLMAHFTVSDSLGTVESKSCPQAVFLSALSIAVHNEGQPDYRKDYEDAESIQGEIRWIP